METAVAHPVHINPMIEIIISFGGLLTALLDTCTAQLTYAPLLGDLLQEALQEWMYQPHTSRNGFHGRLTEIPSTAS